jgi:hypothetical protein
MRRIVILAAFLTVGLSAWGQPHQPTPFNMGSMTVDGCSEGNYIEASLQPSLSWVPYRGGRLRYKVNVSMAHAKVGYGMGGQDGAKACYSKLKERGLTLVLKDQNGFQLEEIPLVLRFLSGDDGYILGLVAEGSIEMHADEYAQLNHDDYSVRW